MSQRTLIAAIGRFRPGPERALFDHYRSRLRQPLILKEFEEKRPMPAPERMRREGRLLLDCPSPGARLVALDGRGVSLSSELLAQRLALWRDEGQSEIAFLIGGADGHDEAVLDSAQLVLSLGAMTWPHMLVRGMLAEQLFRAECILAGHPYHGGH